MAPLPPARVPTNQSRGEELGVGDSEGVPEEEPVGDPVDERVPEDVSVLVMLGVCVPVEDAVRVIVAVDVDVGLGNARTMVRMRLLDESA